jgi:hypothetical protein
VYKDAAAHAPPAVGDAQAGAPVKPTAADIWTVAFGTKSPGTLPQVAPPPSGNGVTPGTVCVLHVMGACTVKACTRAHVADWPAGHAVRLHNLLGTAKKGMAPAMRVAATFSAGTWIEPAMTVTHPLRMAMDGTV